MEIGDRITYVAVTNVLVATEMLTVGDARWGTAGGGQAGTGEWLSAETEGTRWVFGWHDRDSEQGKALLAARALTRDDAVLRLPVAPQPAWAGKARAMLNAIATSPIPTGSVVTLRSSFLAG